MDKKQCQETILQIERELDLHDMKYSDNPSHINCRTRFLSVIAALQTELANELTRAAQISSESELNFDPDNFGKTDFHPVRMLLDAGTSKKNL